ncbi:hypothetical protein AMAG_05240 [Allomyces macrogynus ATCC 38327]|uniref:Uncharacterized protein n=1 Tax=Allomyces macrogynus (strain ATCC 38327) TaxID=578462 RepID=A0A0L0SBB5_ALLM3|nr:hypothetical protein AMAG_05240 [Allomyces macrogynus ATCC 38327]|eukprot:KNE59776.1 hypothetical protein AMAG_05240 [Allomyces macrogynus ATCC 38327]
MADLAKLFGATWTTNAAALPALAMWDDVQTAFMKPVMAEHANELALPGNRMRFAIITQSFQDVTTGPWSMDMIRAVRRQRRFSAMIANVAAAGSHAMYHFHTIALTQYPKFLAAMLHPARYAQQTCMLTGHVVNHDDSDDKESEARIADGAKGMPELWMALYGEDYHMPNVSCAAGAQFKTTDAFAAAVHWDTGQLHRLRKLL